MTVSGRILVIEDDDMLRETLGEVLTDEGYEVRLASSGQEGLDQLDGWDAHVVILDIMMPRMDAYEFHEHRRRRVTAGTSAPKVLVVSAARDIESAAERLDATAWLAKPFNLGEMIAAVDMLVMSPAN